MRSLQGTCCAGLFESMMGFYSLYEHCWTVSWTLIKDEPLSLHVDTADVCAKQHYLYTCINSVLADVSDLLAVFRGTLKLQRL